MSEDPPSWREGTGGVAGAAGPCQSQSTAWEGACSRPASLGTPALPTDSPWTPVGPSLISARPPGPLMVTQSPHSKLEEPPLRALREEPCPSPTKLGEAPGNPHSPRSPPPPTHLCLEEAPSHGGASCPSSWQAPRVGIPSSATTTPLPIFLQLPVLQPCR